MKGEESLIGSDDVSMPTVNTIDMGEDSVVEDSGPDPEVEVAAQQQGDVDAAGAQSGS